MECPNEIIKGLGTDIIEIGRIQKAIEKYGSKFISRIFTKVEQDYCKRHKNPYPSYAGRFAAKEAAFKTFGTQLSEKISWLDVEVVNASNGSPEIILSESLKKLFPFNRLLVSMSHCKDYATATVIRVLDGKT